MSAPALVFLAAGAALAPYTAIVVALLVVGRRSHARAVAGFVPDCAVLFARLARDPEIRSARKAVIALLAAYLASPVDVVPDFVPVLGQLDDAVLVVVALRWLLSSAGSERIARHWPGPAPSLRSLLRLAGVAPPHRG
jgi:uncharacterized membrane protein YkvA (DUF1232 family)